MGREGDRNIQEQKESGTSPQSLIVNISDRLIERGNNKNGSAPDYTLDKL